MQGAIAGLIGAFIQTCFSFTMKSIGLTDRIFMDYGEVLVLGQHKIGSGLGLLIGFIAHLVNAMFWGIVFSHIIKFSNKNYILLKGIGYGLIIWLFSLGMATMFKLPVFEVIELNVGYVLMIGAMIYGSVMSLTYKYLISK